MKLTVRAGTELLFTANRDRLAARVTAVDGHRQTVEVEVGGEPMSVLRCMPAEFRCGGLPARIAVERFVTASSALLRVGTHRIMALKCADRPGVSEKILYNVATPRQADPDTERLARRYLEVRDAEDSDTKRLVTRQWWDAVRADRAVLAGGWVWVYSRSEDAVRRLPKPTRANNIAGCRPALL